MWSMAQQIGYKPVTTFWEDFSIAEIFGEQAIRDTAERAFNEWHYDYKFLTELIMVINHKSWEYVNKNPDLCEFYGELYYEFDEKAIQVLDGNEEALNYYFKTLD